MTIRQWSWETGTPFERAEMVRRHLNSPGLHWDSVRELFNLTDEGIRMIARGENWCEEYVSLRRQGSGA